MNDVYRLIPMCIPQELHMIIYIYAGTCTPSSKNIKLYKEQIKHDIFPLNTDGLWGALIGYNATKYTLKSFNVTNLTNQELEMKIAFIQNRHERLSTHIKRWGEMNENELSNSLIICHNQIAQVQKEQSCRLFYKYAMLMQTSPREEI
jgi:hypothetical protein